DEALMTDNRWEVFFHLSDMRQALFGWYDMPKDADVLEIGCGFGALTGVLSERAAHVAAQDDSLFRARACAKRWAMKDNIDVYAGRLRDIPFPQRFDVITLVDILPRVAGGKKALAPYSAYLKSLLAYLKPQGRLLLAMDNRLGLKFFCGSPDPYSDELFGELSEPHGEGRLFTRSELVEIFSTAGFAHWKFYYPLPDYRLPQFIFTDAALPGPSLGEVMLPYDPTPDTRVLPEETLYADIVQNGLFPAAANSFLIECGMTKDFCPTESASVACDRAPIYNIATCREGERFLKKPVMTPAQQGIREIAENLETLRQRGLDIVPCELKDGQLIMPRLEAPTMAAWLQTATPKNREVVLAALERLWAAILQSSPPVPDTENCMKKLDAEADWGVILAHAYLNMTPDNIFYQNGRLTFFNQGLCRPNTPAKYLMFLGVYDNAETLQRIGLLDEAKERYGLVRLWGLMESTQHKNVAQFRRYEVYHRFYDWAAMSPARMAKNRQVLKIIGNEED
ncbi:MAG: methyltransferase domain-containing protein, partial [Schwartzia sp.]|nr:methyltransferase domain-containing protein [Schwartzia sp. (in: firmicutes)]